MSNALINSIVALIDSRIAVHLANVGAGQAQAQVAPSATPTPAPTATPAAINDPFGLGTTAGTAAPAIEVTPKMLTELIMPLLSNEAAKQRLQQAMHSMGISELPAARPDQLPELYGKFKAIADEMTGAAAAPAAPAAPAGGVTII